MSEMRMLATKIVFPSKFLPVNSDVPTGIYFFQVYNGNNKTVCEDSKLTIKTPE